ncbi:unnamed protein product, partial [Owenia fusiformis]
SIGGVGMRGVEGVLIANILKSLVTRFMDSYNELHSHENLSMYCDVKQLICYIKEAHGGTFRRVALSGLLDSIVRDRKPEPQKEASPETPQPVIKEMITKPVRRTQSAVSDFGGEDRSSSPHMEGGDTVPRKSRRSIFQKRNKKHFASNTIAVSDTEILDEYRIHGRLSPRTSISATEDDYTGSSNPTTPKRKFSKFQLSRTWKKSSKSDHEDDSANESMTPDLQRQNRNGIDFHNRKGRMSFKTAGHATLSFLSARRRLEDGIKNFGRRLSKRGSIEDDMAHRVGGDLINSLGTEASIIKERKLVNSYAVKSGMFRFNFLLDCCTPGSVPDPPLIAAMLDLEAPIVARAALLLECAHFVHRCNKGDWPQWMRLNLPSFRQTAQLHSRGQTSAYKRNLAAQRQAARMFHMWGEAIGTRLEEILKIEKMDIFTLLSQIRDDSKKRELRNEDDEEDFLDEATVNHSGSDCPYALKMIACQVLLEITTFLRETYQYLPKSKLPKQERWDKPVSRRYSTAQMSSPGHSDKSITSPTGDPPQGFRERKISFAVLDDQESVMSTLAPPSGQKAADTISESGSISPSERKISFAIMGTSCERSDSLHSSTTTLSMPEGGEERKAARRLAQGRKLLKMRRGSITEKITAQHNASLKRQRSLKLKQEGGSGGGSVENESEAATAEPKPEREAKPEKTPFSRKSIKLKRPKSQATQGSEKVQSHQGPQVAHLTVHRTHTEPDHSPVESTSDLSPDEAVRENLLEDYRRPSAPFSQVQKIQQSLRRKSEHLLSPLRTGIKRMGSLTNRKVSIQSTKSERSDEDHTFDDYTEAPPLVTTTDEPQDSPEVEEEIDYSQNMPWIKIVVRLANTSNFVCDHQNYCNPNCYERQRRSCCRLMAAVKHVHESRAEDEAQVKERGHIESRRDTLKDKFKRRESMFQPSSPTRRRESTPLLNKISAADVTLLRSKLNSMERKKNQEQQEPVIPDTPMQTYLKSQVQNLTQNPMSIFIKAAPILPEDVFANILPVAWELLLENDQELAAASASVFLISAVKAPEQVQDIMTKELAHEDTTQRINALLRYEALWRYRYQVWPRMEDGANLMFKLPPPSIDFVLPSPTIGLPSLPIVDPPWTPHFKTKVEEVTVTQDESKSFVTATTTRRKQQIEMIHKALLAEEDRKREARENFPLTTVAIAQQAAYEPALHHVTEEHEEGDEERTEHTHSHHMQMAQHFFPSCISMAVLPIIHLLEDVEVNPDGISVCEVAEKVIHQCLVEEPQLFFKHFLEKLTNKSKQEELLYLLRKLLLHMPELPSQTAHMLFNYLLGFIMFYVRSPTEGGQDAIGSAMSVIWLVVPSVHGIFFKDLKQTLKKEQCDPTLMITANVPSTKKVIVHGPDLSSIPSQFPVREDTQFIAVLQDSLEFFNIPENEHNAYFLIDTKSHQMHNLDSYVRDFYFFRRNFYPQLTMIHMNPEEAFKTLQKQALTLKTVEIGKVLFSKAILDGTPANQLSTHVSFIHEELTKLPSFPRKALEADFGLYKGSLHKEVGGVDMIHKYVWTKLINTLFSSMSSTTTWTCDLTLFLNAVNGTLLLHCEDSAMVRLCLSVFINASRRFKHVFATNGYLFIMPNMLRVYSNYQTNPQLCKAIEFACKQFYILHRKPFILQMFGSIAPILDMDIDAEFGDCNKVLPETLFDLLVALSKSSCPDELDILDLIEGEKPLKALDFCYEDEPDSFSMSDAIDLCVTVDFCYEDEPDSFSMSDAIDLCVTVVAYASDSLRSQQMLTILEAIVPYYLKQSQALTLKRDTPVSARSEMDMIQELSISMRALVVNCEALTRNLSGPKHIDVATSNLKPTHNHSNHSPSVPGMFYDDREDSTVHVRYMEEGRSKSTHHHDHEEEIAMLKEFRRPRDSLLCVIAEFYVHCSARVKDLRKRLNEVHANKYPDLLDHKAHNKLADVAHTLLKMAPYDPHTMSCRGLQRYILEILPMTDWSQEAVRPALNLILRRLERLFHKIYKKTTLRRHLDWDCAASLLRGVYMALHKYNFIAHLPYLKSLINTTLHIVLADASGLELSGSSHDVHHRSSRVETNVSVATVPTPQAFCSAVVKLTAMQMQALGDQFSLEHICGGMSVFPTQDKTQNMLVNLVLPLLIRVGCGRKDSPRMSQTDINFALTVILHAVVPPSKQSSSHGGKSTNYLSVSIGEMGRSGSVSQSDKQSRTRDSLYQIAFLGLKILLVCFERQLTPELHRVANCIKEMGTKLNGGLALWRFLDFLTSYRPSLFIILQPFIQYKMLSMSCATQQEYFIQHAIHEKLRGKNMPPPRSIGNVLMDLASELRSIRDDINALGEMRSRTATMASERSQQSYSTGRYTRRSVADLYSEQQGRKSTVTIPPPLLKKASKVNVMPLNAVATPGTPVSIATSPEAMVTAPVPAPVGLNSPKLTRKQSSRRIKATEGSNEILERFKKQQIDEDSVDAPLANPSRSKLHRQGSVYQKGYITKQRSICPIGEEMATEIISENILDEHCEDEGSELGSPSSPTSDGASGSPDFTTRGHRLQRQDAKSRKTFKIKRQKSRDLISIRRTQTVASRRYGMSGPAPLIEEEKSPGVLRKVSTVQEEGNIAPPIVESEQSHPQITEDKSGNSPNRGSNSSIDLGSPSDTEVKQSMRARYISKSQEDILKSAAPPGTVRGRIARQGARIVRSRSPSTSPVRHSGTPSPTHSIGAQSAPGGTYMRKGDSTDSVNSENAALLKSEDRLTQSPIIG